jgi:hypothetical protein
VNVSYREYPFGSLKGYRIEEVLYSMKNSMRHSLSMLAICGTALLLMGASSEVWSDLTNTAGTLMKSSVTSTAISRTTGSVASKGTNSITSRQTNSVTSGVTSSVTGSAVNRVTTPPVVLSPYAEELAGIIKFDRQVLITVKEVTRERIQRLIGFDEEGFQIIAPGIAVAVPEDETDHILAVLRKKLVPLKYMPFVVEMNAGLKIDKIGIIKGTDQYEILRIMQTAGDEYDITNEDVIEQLKEWEMISTFEIIGADSDWVEIEFKTLPKDLKAFAEAVYDFSPDTIDEGPGSIDGLIKELKGTRKLFLSWD